MRGTIIHGPGDIRYEQLPDPQILADTDAILRTVATSVCGSDLWEYRGLTPITTPHPTGHEYLGIVEEVGAAVTHIEPGQYVLGSFFASDNTCPHCRRGLHSCCQSAEFITGCQAEYVRVPHAEGTLLALPDWPDKAAIPSLLALSDVMGSGWFAATAAHVTPAATVVVVGDGAVGLCGILAAHTLGARRIIAMSRNPHRQKIAQRFGATDLVTERGEEGIAVVRELTHGLGADAVLECVGTNQSLNQAIHIARPGGTIGAVGLPHNIDLPYQTLFYNHVGLRGGPAPVRAFLPDLLDLVMSQHLDPGPVFDLTLPLAQVGQAYEAMHQRRAIKTLLYP